MNKRYLAVAITGLLGICATSVPLRAQTATNEASSPQEKDVQTLKTVEVTGTRIKSSSLAAATPVLKIDAQEIKQTGLVSVGDILQELSLAGSGLNTHNNNAGQMGSPPDGSGIGGGAAQISLRDLGTKRTLVLVNGLRWINGSSGSGVAAAVDLNTIPASAIERIDILPNGASALYGADAVAGVVNIITKTSQKGASVTGYYGVHKIDSTYTGQTSTGNVSIGGTGDRYDFFVTLDHTKENPISANVWSGSRICVPGVGLAGCSAASPVGNFQFTTPDGNDYGGLCPGGFCKIAPNHAVSGVPQRFPQDFHKFGNQDRYNYAPDQQLMMMLERTSAFASGTYNITPTTKAYMRLTYTDRTSRDRISPTLFSIGSGSCSPGSPSCDWGIDVTNPYNPFGFSLNSRTDPTVSILRRFVENSYRRFSQRSHMRDLNAGVQGTFGIGDRGFSWDVNIKQATNNASEIGGNLTNGARMAVALGPLAGCQAAPGCVPLDLFGGLGTVTPEMLNYLRYDSLSTSHQSLGLFTANLSGDLIELPAGWLDFASGYEHRGLAGNYVPDLLTQQGITGVPIEKTAGSFHADSLYLEFNVPILADVPGAKDLSVDVASRYDRYSTFGGTTDSQGLLRWQPTEELTFRGTWGQGFRAPSIGELFGSRRFSSSYVIDPCNVDNPVRGTGSVLANCQQLGVPQLDSFHQTNIQISTATGGNRNLQPERSRSSTVGVVYSPAWAADTSWARKLDFSFTYYKIALKNGITAADAQTIVSRCMQTLDPIFCSNVTRGGSGQITEIEDTLQNLGSVDTSGFDATASWFAPATAVGTFGVSVSGTYAKEFRSVNGFTGLAEPQAVGVETANWALPRIRARGLLNWSRGAWSGLWTMRYISALKGNCGPASGYPICNEQEVIARFSGGQRRMGATVYNDVRASWVVPTAAHLTVSAGINNVFDKRPPMCTTCTLGGYDATTYSLPGRFFYTSATLDF